MMQPVPVGSAYILRATVHEDTRIEPRMEDLQEWDKSIAGGVQENLLFSIRASAECYTVAGATDNVPHIIFGVCLAKPIPVTWMLASDVAQRDAVWITGALRPFYTGFFERWPRTVCYSAPENTIHHHWLKWLGYRHDRSLTWGDYRQEFYEFIKEKDRLDV